MTSDWKKLKEHKVKMGYRGLVRRTFKLPDGRIDDFDIKDEGEVVCIVSLTAENNIVLVRQYRPGPEKALLEIPGGRVDEGEKPATAAARELLEETGYKGKMEFVGTSWDCGYSTRLRYNYVSLDSKKVQEQQLEENEFAKVVEMSLNKFRVHLRSGELTDVESGYLCLDYLKLL